MRYKNDDEELVDVANFIRSLFPQLRVKIELYVLFNEDGSYDTTTKKIYQGNTQHFRNPDLTVFLDKKLVCFIEIDGSVHDAHVEKTDKRNSEYEKAGLDLIVVNKEELKLSETNMFEYIEKELLERLAVLKWS